MLAPSLTNVVELKMFQYCTLITVGFSVFVKVVFPLVDRSSTLIHLLHLDSGIIQSYRLLSK